MPATVKLQMGFYILSILLSSCSNNSIKTFEALNSSLENSSLLLNQNSQHIYYSLKERLQDPASVERTSIIYPKATMAVFLADNLFQYLEAEKNELKSKGKRLSKQSSFEMHDTCLKYFQKIIAIDSNISEIFQKDITSIIPDPTIPDKNFFFDSYFKDQSMIANVSMISRIQNNMRSLSSKILAYFYSKTTYHAIIDEFYSPLVSINSYVFQPGQTIEITAGIAAFSKIDNSEILVGGSKINIEENGMAQYKMQASSNVGTHKIPVVIKFVNPNTLKPQELIWELVYKVVLPCDQNHKP